MIDYFSDRELGKQPPHTEEVSDEVWSGIRGRISALIDNGAFGESFPETCRDDRGTVGTDRTSFWNVCKAEIPHLPEYPEHEKPDTTFKILDLIQFCHRNVSSPIQLDWHPHFRHHHLKFDKQSGQKAFHEDMNTIFSRNRIAFQLLPDGQISRILPPEINHLIACCEPSNEDGFEKLFDNAKKKIRNPDPEVRKEALDHIWDAWERLKSLEKPGDKNKAESTKILLDLAASTPEFRELLEEEANELTKIGNAFWVRHSETNQISITDPLHVDYLFYRMLSMFFLLLAARRRTP